MIRIKSKKEAQIKFSSFGVNIKIVFDENFIDSELINFLDQKFPTLIHLPVDGREYFEFYLGLNSAGYLDFRFGTDHFQFNDKESLFELLDSRIRITIAEFAENKVFIHAGVVSWKGKAIVIPGKSFFGKTTLVSELIKKGAEYLSDEYAVFDDKGFVHPFPKMLSMRGIVSDFVQVDTPLEKFNAKVAANPVEVGMVFFTEYKRNSYWKPKKITSGQAMMEILPHTIPIRIKPEFTLKVLNNVMNRAIISKTKRGEAERFADLLLGFFERQAIEVNNN